MPYLEAGHYFGVEAHQALLDAGFEKELAKVGLQSKVPRANLLASDCFEFDHFEQSFEFAIAQSLFTHISMNSIRLCLTRLSQVMPRGGKFFATFFENQALEDGEPLVESGSKTVTYWWRDPFHYRRDDLAWLASRLPWHMSYIGDWGHPSK